MSLADESSLLFIPTGYRESKIYSVFPTTGVGDFTFNRNSSATRIAKNGLITSVSTDIPRLEYPLIDGVVNGCPSFLLEGEATNEWLYSEDFSNAGWTKTNVTITSNQVISPDGTLNASKITDDATSGEHRIRGNTVFISSVANFSIFAKAAEYSTFAIANLSDLFITKFDLSNGTIISTGSGWSDAKIEDYGNGWYKLSVKISANKTCGYGLLNDNGDFVFSGDGTKGVYIWGAQFEQGSFPTSYIKSNSGSTTTRAAETANGAGDATTFNDSEGVLMVEVSALANIGSFENISLSNGSSASRLIIFYRNTLNVIEFRVTVNNVIQMQLQYTIEDAKSFNKMLIKYKQNDFSVWINGFELHTDNSGITFGSYPLTNLSFDNGQVSAPSSPFYGKTKQIQYYNSALTDLELEEISSWTSFTDLANGQQYSIK